MRRLSALLASGNGTVEAECAFSRDAENRSIVALRVRAELEVTCQRCLESLPLAIAAENRLAIVSDDDMAKQLPADLDPWVVEAEQGNLWALVEDELILEVPAVAYHDTEACKQLLDAYRQPPATQERDGDNPFKVLEQLKQGTGTQEN